MDKITELVNQYEIDKVDAGCLYNNQELKENLIKKLKEAINYSRCCKSDSGQLVCELCEKPLEKVFGKVCENTICERHR